MAERRDLSRRDLLKGSGSLVAGFATFPAWATVFNDQAKESPETEKWIGKIKDPVIRSGVRAAVNKNLLAAATEIPYPGHFTISADGGAYGQDTTWPGLDSWQMAGAYLLIGQTRLVTDYFDFVRASQRNDGNIPFAIFNGDTRPGDTYLRGMKYPDDEFTYIPPHRSGASRSSQETKQWIGLFRHWEMKSDPLSTLGPVCYVLTASEIFATTHDKSWIKERLASVEAAATFLYHRVSDIGLVSGSGFYTELPPRFGWDGVTQCYVVHAFRELAKVMKALGITNKWAKRADELTRNFVKVFWRGDHFGEYVHMERGLVDSHGLSDTNWAAVAFGLTDDKHLKALWPRLVKEKSFWLGGVPTQSVTKPFAYEEWENDPVPFGIPSTVNDVAAMGRVWYLEAMACRKMHDHMRLVDSTRQVCLAAIEGFWRERYHPKPDGTVEAAGAEKYCEYPAVLTRVVLGTRQVFCA